MTMIRMTGVVNTVRDFKILKYAHPYCGETAQTISITYTKNANYHNVGRGKVKGSCADWRASWLDFVRNQNAIDPFFASDPVFSEKVGGA
jgi:hypothetical protein